MRYLICLTVLLSSCAIPRTLVEIDYNTKPPADWPVLEERITYADVQTVQRWCNMPQALRDRAFNCAVVSFRYNLCMIYLSSNDPEALRHERAHCAGYSHVGEGKKSHQAWERFKKAPSDGLVAQ
jgi:hypothetical protein